MVTKRIRSEYMKKFKDPKWETYTKCYEEMLGYRLTRRLLEQTHNPWFWSGSDSDSDSGGRSPPPPSKSQVRSEGEEERRDRQQVLDNTSTRPVPRLPLQEEEQEVPAGRHAGSQPEDVRQTGEQEEREEQRASKQSSAAHRDGEQERDTGQQRSKQSKPSRSSKQTRHSHRVRPAPLRPPREDSKDNRHSFALYGSGEKNADIGTRKTHNVAPAASTSEIHESALRAKTRREVERQFQSQRAERRRAKSVDLDKARKLVQPEFNPWLTEYMRCFSARSR